MLPPTLREFRELSKNIDDALISQFIGEAQTIEIRGFLGDELYTAMQNDFDDGAQTFTEDRFTDLWFGTEYDGIKTNGLQMALVYFTFARLVLRQPQNVTRFGVDDLTGEEWDSTTMAQIKTKANEDKSLALYYQRQSEKFIEFDTTSFPEYSIYNTTPKTTSFSFFRLK